MTLVAILLALGLEHFASHYRDRGLFEARHGPLTRLRAGLPAPRLWRSPLWAGALLLLPTAAVAALQAGIDGSPWRLVLDFVVLFLCLGPRDLADDVHRLIAARQAGDAHAVRRLTRNLMRGPAPDSDRRNLLGTLFIQSHERLFGVLIWFIVGGAGGAVFYRLASRLPRLFGPNDGVAGVFMRSVHAVAAWLPIRATALLFGLAGSLDDALTVWRTVPRSLPWARRSWTLLAQVASAALDVEIHGARVVPARLETALAEVLRMQRRALLLLLALFALYTAGAWLA